MSPRLREHNFLEGFMFTKQHLQNVGFNRFIPLLGDLSRIPARPCIYAVVWAGSEEPNVIGRSTGGWFKRKDPTVDAAVAQVELVPGSATLYIGRAQNGRADSNYSRGSAEASLSHTGAGATSGSCTSPGRLLVGWREEADPVRAEAELLDEFESHFGQLPYANLVRGRRHELASA
jgi:hypothetical protein